MDEGPALRAESRHSPLTVTVSDRVLEGYPLSETELEMLKSTYVSVNLSLLGVAVGAFFTLLVTLLTVDLTERTEGIFIGLVIMTGLFGVYLAASAVRDHQRASKLVDKIKQASLGASPPPV